MNKVFIVGRLVRNPELRYNINNVAICRFSLAVNRPKQKDKEQETDFINCVAYNKLAENIQKYQVKGNLLAIIGRIQTSSYDAQDGTRKYTTDVVVNEAQFLTTKSDSQSGQEQQQSGQETETTENPKDDLAPFEQMAAKIEMDEDYNPELKVDDSMLPFWEE